LGEKNESIDLKEKVEELLEGGLKESIKKMVGEENEGRTMEAMLLMKYFKVNFNEFFNFSI
jgi:hypothetical protein